MSDDISLAKFLSRYTSLKGKNLKKLTHDDVKILLPDISRCPLSLLKEHPEYVFNGKVVFVYDGNRTIPYFIPRIKELEEQNELVREEVEPIKVDDTVYDYSKLSNYKLRCLLPRKYNSVRNQNCAKKEFARRGITLHKDYNRSEVKRMILKERKDERD